MGNPWRQYVFGAGPTKSKRAPGQPREPIQPRTPSLPESLIIAKSASARGTAVRHRRGPSTAANCSAHSGSKDGNFFRFRSSVGTGSIRAAAKAGASGGRSSSNRPAGVDGIAAMHGQQKVFAAVASSRIWSHCSMKTNYAWTAMARKRTLGVRAASRGRCFIFNSRYFRPDSGLIRHGDAVR